MPPRHRLLLTRRRPDWPTGPADQNPPSSCPRGVGRQLELGRRRSTPSGAGIQRGGRTEPAPRPDFGLGVLGGFPPELPGPIVLVGHSYGGMVVTNAATGNPNVKALVYVDAFIPAQGETAFQLVDAKPGSCLNNPDPSQVLDVTTFPGAPAGDYEAYVKASVFTQCFANDFSPSQAAVAAAVQRPLTLDAGGTPSGVPDGRRFPRGQWSERSTTSSRQRSNSSWPSVRAHTSRSFEPHICRWSRNPAPWPTSSCKPLAPLVDLPRYQRRFPPVSHRGKPGQRFFMMLNREEDGR